MVPKFQTLPEQCPSLQNILLITNAVISKAVTEHRDRSPLSLLDIEPPSSLAILQDVSSPYLRDGDALDKMTAAGYLLPRAATAVRTAVTAITSTMQTSAVYGLEALLFSYIFPTGRGTFSRAWWSFQ